MRARTAALHPPRDNSESKKGLAPSPRCTACTSNLTRHKSKRVSTVTPLREECGVADWSQNTPYRKRRRYSTRELVQHRPALQDTPSNRWRAPRVRRAEGAQALSAARRLPAQDPSIARLEEAYFIAHTPPASSSSFFAASSVGLPEGGCLVLYAV